MHGGIQLWVLPLCVTTVTLETEVSTTRKHISMLQPQRGLLGFYFESILMCLWQSEISGTFELVANSFIPTTAKVDIVVVLERAA